MSTAGSIQGQQIEVTVVECTKLNDKEWFSRQDPYVCLEYGDAKFRTRTCTDGGKNPTFREKFNIVLCEGRRDLKVLVWNSNTLTSHDFIGSGTVQFNKVLSQGYDDSTWSIQSNSGRYAGEVKLILHYGNVNKPAATSCAPPAPAAPCVPTILTPSYPPSSVYTAPSMVYPPYLPNPQPAVYSLVQYPPPSNYPPSSQTAASFPPMAYLYPPQPQPYPPPTQATPYFYPPAPYPGSYPSPPPY
ncbi:PREDICTED: U1 small nuclear ribonucleoprotein C-like [Nelumbo nucifera]|uniref:U1 small nuclear ribonucleoprotein C-like n=2 Tax=Nelumbo nucifera TaxID=4432 RepID=A0A1U7Z0Y9_NELNU|nr:PREDICTED: U1 small nuclear ribonucleoprotein C-like [Nelumbo nucifera]XP_010244245.1 PREDICTED: U1 small nuclear ribonucleoprotein C-like [Nelumbo nucifera]DAD21456.1 TPA_asm: hypothetical protein HUJ06_022919 [Nelumbo nucifera]